MRRPASSTSGSARLTSSTLAPLSRARKFERTRSLLLRRPRPGRGTCEWRTGEAKVVERHPPRAVAPVPADASGGGRQGQRLAEYPRRIEFQVAAVELQRTVELIEVEAAGDARHPWHAVHRGEADALHHAAGGKDLGQIGRACPAEFAVGDAASRRKSGEVAAPCLPAAAGGWRAPSAVRRRDGRWTSCPPVMAPSAFSVSARLKLVGASVRSARVVKLRPDALSRRLPGSRFQSRWPARFARSSCGRLRASRVRTSASSKSATMPVGPPPAKSNHARSAPLPLSTGIGSGIHSRQSAMSA